MFTQVTQNSAGSAEIFFNFHPAGKRPDGGILYGGAGGGIGFTGDHGIQ